jgi:general secretion pathway protein C
MLALLVLVAVLAAGPDAPADLAAVGVVLSANPERSVAILQSGGRTRTAAVGDPAFGGRVTAVSRQRVALDFGGRLVELKLTRGADLPAPRRFEATHEPAGPPAGEAMGVGAGPKRRVLSRADVERRLNAELPKLAQAALRPVTEDGRVIGMRVSLIPEGTLLQEVGIRSGDVITELNGVKVDGLPALAGLWSSLQGASELDATVLRDGVIVGLGVSLR